MGPRLKKYLLYVPVATVVGTFLYILIETVKLKNTGFVVKRFGIGWNS